MIALVNASCFTSTADLQARFLTIRVRIERHARIYFRACKCPAKKEDHVAETVALAWKWFRRLAEKGKDATRFPSVLASFAARAVRSGRRLCGQEKAKDVLSPVCQQRHHFSVSKLPDCSTLSANPLTEALEDNRRSPVPDQVAFRCDFPSWLRTHSQRNRRIIHAMALGERTKDLSQRFRISPARISQLRREFCADWKTYCGE